MINLPLKIRVKRRSMKDVHQPLRICTVVIILAGMIFPVELQAQKSIEIGILGGAAYYNGDINPGKPFVEPRGAFGLLARYNFDNRWAVKGTITHGMLAGAGSVPDSHYTGNIKASFSANVDELALTGEFNFWKYETGNNMQRLSPYIMGGGGIFHYSGNSDKDAIKTSYSGISPTFIFGLGFKYSLTKKLGLAAEWGMRKTLTDNLDHVSYANSTGLNNKDWYNFTVASITYKIDLTKGMSCKSLKW